MDNVPVPAVSGGGGVRQTRHTFTLPANYTARQKPSLLFCVVCCVLLLRAGYGAIVIALTGS